MSGIAVSCTVTPPYPSTVCVRVEETELEKDENLLNIPLDDPNDPKDPLAAGRIILQRGFTAYVAVILAQNRILDAKLIVECRKPANTANFSHSQSLSSRPKPPKSA